MVAYIDLITKSHKGGATFINDEVETLEERKEWFDINMDYLEHMKRSRRLERVTIYVKEQYNVIYSKDI